MLEQQHLPRGVQVIPAQAAVPQVQDALARAGERRRELEHPVPELGRGHGIAAVQGLHPGEGGRRALLPADQARANGHALPGHLVAHRQVGEHRAHAAAGAPHLGPAGEPEPGHPERERPPQVLHQQVRPVGRVDQPVVEPGRAQFGALAADRVDPARHRRGQRLEAVLVGAGAQQVLVGRELGELPRGLLHLRLGGRLGGRPALRGRGQHQERPAIAGPAERPRGVPAQHVAHGQPGYLGDRTGFRVGDPQPDPVEPVDGDRETAPVRGPGRRPHLGSLRQAQCPLGSVGHPQHRQAARPAQPAPRPQMLVQPEPGQRQVGPGQHGHRRMRLVLDERHMTATGGEQDGRRRRRVDHRHDVGGRGCVRHWIPSQNVEMCVGGRGQDNRTGAR